MANRSETRFVRKIVAEIKREGFAVTRLREEAANSHVFSRNRTRQDFNVANIPYGVQGSAKGQETCPKLASNARLQRGRNIQKMDGQAAAFVLDPHVRIGVEERLQVRPHTAQRRPDAGRKRTLGTALPSIKTEIVDAAYSNMLEQFRAAATADHHEGSERVPRKASQNFSRRGLEAYHLGPWCDVDQRSVEIKENGDASMPPNFLRDTIPIF
jgi:hypothetical protein